jgi:hypothetical protein
MLNKCLHLALIFSLISIPREVYGQTFERTSSKVKIPKNIKSLNDFFLENPITNKFTWSPNFGDLERFSFIIPRKGYFFAEKLQDSSELYYLSKVVDDGLNFVEKTKLNTRVQFELSGDTTHLMFSKKIRKNLSAGLNAISKDSFSFGSNITYQYILNKMAILNFEIVAQPYKLSQLKMSTVHLSKNEQYEIFLSYNIYENVRPNQLNFGITWFDINDFFDITTSAEYVKTSLNFDIYSTLEFKENRFNIGMKNIQNTSSSTIYMEFTRPLHRVKSTEYLVRLNNGKGINFTRKSLKKLRKKELPDIWRKRMSF